MIYGIGVDIADISRFRTIVENGNGALLNRLFTERERAVCDGRKDSASCYAARFAAKEAFLKALGTGLRDGISWHDMEITPNQLGRPELHLSGRSRELSGEYRLTAPFLSLSHDSGSAVAMVVLETAS